MFFFFPLGHSLDSAVETKTHFLENGQGKPEWGDLDMLAFLLIFNARFQYWFV